jgi:hypothetical protein
MFFLIYGDVTSCYHGTNNNSIGRYNDNGEKQFDYFFSKFINEIMSKNEIELDFDLFKTRAKNNINLLFLDFVVIFINFDLNFKKMFKNYKKL